MRNLILVFCLLILFIVAVLWWGSLLPRRPASISAAGIFIERGSTPLKLSVQGNWVDCWGVKSTNTNRCKVTDERGTAHFEDLFVTSDGTQVAATDLAIDPIRTRLSSIGLPGVSVPVPLIFLKNGQILLPQSGYDKGMKTVEAIHGARRRLGLEDSKQK